MRGARWELRSDTLRVKNGRETRELWAKPWKNGPTLSQILLSVIDKTAYLGGNICTRILTNRQQLGPRAETHKQEGRFSYNMQLPDRQELLRLSRNIDRKMTPWNKEHSNGLRSQDHIVRTRARLCARPVPLETRQHELSGDTKIAEIRHRELRLRRARKQVDEIRLCWNFHNFSTGVATLARRVFLARNKLIREPGCVGKKTRACTTCNSQIVKPFPGLAGILTGKMPSERPKTLRWPLFVGPYLSAPSSVSRNSETLQERVAQAFQRYQVRRNLTSGARSIVRANWDKI